MGISTDQAAPLDDLLSTRKIAQAFGYHINTIRRWNREGKFPPPININGRLRWRRSTVAEWVVAQVANSATTKEAVTAH